MQYSKLVSSLIQHILDKALSGIIVSREELIALLSLNPNGSEANALRLTGQYISQQRFGTRSTLLCQTGVESFPCPADCSFCSFRQSTYTEATWRITEEQLTEINGKISDAQGISAHFLLFMHTFDFSYVLQIVEMTRAQLPASTNVVINCGDLDSVQAEELHAAGADGAYHVVRLREGKDTRLSRGQRIKSIKALKKTNMNWYTCCEPIGPEHSNEEITDNILLAAQYDCFQNAVMRRINFPGSILEPLGQITLLRSAQIVAVVAIAMQQNTQLSSITVHEPDLLGLNAGANCVFAEFGANPREIHADPSSGRGHSVAYCQALLRDAGFSSLMRNNGYQDIPL